MPTPEPHMIELGVPIGAYGRTWPMLVLRRLACADLIGLDDHQAISRCASVPLAAIYDLAPGDLAAAVEWLRGGQ